MKKILGLAVGLMMTALTFGQATATFLDATAGYNKSTATSFNFVFSPAHAESDIKNNATYYESYFKVAVSSAGSAGNNVKITLVEDNEMARRVILRLLVSLDINAVNVNGESYERNDFISKYIATDF